MQKVMRDQKVHLFDSKKKLGFSLSAEILEGERGKYAKNHKTRLGLIFLSHEFQQNPYLSIDSKKTVLRKF